VQDLTHTHPTPRHNEVVAPYASGHGALARKLKIRKFKKRKLREKNCVHIT